MKLLFKAPFERYPPPSIKLKLSEQSMLCQAINCYNWSVQNQPCNDIVFLSLGLLNYSNITSYIRKRVVISSTHLLQ